MTRALPLSALLVALAGLVALELRGRADDRIVAEPAAPPTAAAPHATAVTPGTSAAELQTILARPLFAPNRRPPSVAAGPAVAGAPPPSLPRVAGILLDGNRRSVIFAAAGDVRPLVVNEGGEVNGFRVQSIEDGQVTVVGPDGPRVLHPTFDQNPPQAQAPAGPVIPGFAGVPGLTSIPGFPGLPVPSGPVAR